MFRPVGNFLHRTPWWALILLGITVLTLLGLFITPFQVISLQRSGDTPEQKRAIQREIDSSFGQSVLGVAEEAVKAINRHSKDPVRKAELERAIEEIARARSKIETELGETAVQRRDALREADHAAKEAAFEAAQDAYEAAVEARSNIEESQQELRQTLKDAKVPRDEWPKSLDEALKTAKDAEAAAKQKRDAAKLRLRDRKVSVNIGLAEDKPLLSIQNGHDNPDQGADQGAGKGGLTSAPPLPPLPPLPSELRQDIHAKVANDLYHIGIGSALILLFIPLFIVALIAKFFIDRARRAQELAELKKVEADYHNFSRQITEAKLQALQAQVEPHFLYNTLANVQALTEVDPAAAHTMVGHLIQYLRAALPKMRGNVSTVEQEVELTQAYLNILKMRMGDRLSFEIQVADDAKSLSFPPLMLPSLVENSIKHGLEPLREGGHIEIVARRSGDRLLVSVKDTGRGFGQTGDTLGGGVGLANLRERLAALFGAAAKFTIEENQPKGVVATIELPAAELPAPATGNPPAKGDATAAPIATEARAAAAPKAGAKAWSVAAKAHRVWGNIISFTFIALMVLLAVALGVALAALFAGVLPVDIDGLRLNGIEGLAIGSLGLLAAFGAVALALFAVVAVIYGLGVLLAGLLIFIPVVILIAAFPALAPFILLGLLIYWFIRRRNKARGEST